MLDLKTTSKLLLGCSFGMTTSFLLGASSIGLWALTWPIIFSMAGIGGLCWLMASDDDGDPSFSPPPPYSSASSTSYPLGTSPLPDFDSTKPSASAAPLTMPASAPSPSVTFSVRPPPPPSCPVRLSVPVVVPVQRARESSWFPNFLPLPSHGPTTTTRYSTSTRPAVPAIVVPSALSASSVTHTGHREVRVSGAPTMTVRQTHREVRYR